MIKFILNKFNQIIRSYYHNSGLKKALSFFSLNLFAQIIISITNIVNARIFEPSIIGVYSVFYILLNIFGILSGFKLNEALITSQSKTEEKILLNLSYYFIILVSILSFPLIFIYNYFFKFYNNNNSILLLFIFPFYVFFSSMLNLSSSRLVKLGYFNLLGKYKLLQNTVILLINISLFRFLETTIYISLLLSLFITFSIYEFILFRNENIISNFKLKKLFFYLKVFRRKYFDYLRYYVPSSFVNKLSYGLPFLVLPYFTTSTQIAFFTYSNFFTFGLSAILSQTLQQILFHIYSSSFNLGTNEFYLKFKNQLLKLYILSFIFHFTIYISLPYIVLYLLGSKWQESITIARILCFWSMFVLVNSSVSSIFVITNNQKKIFNLELICFIIRLSVLLTAVSFYSYRDSIVIYSFIGLLYEIYLSLTYLKMAKNIKKSTRF